MTNNVSGPPPEDGTAGPLTGTPDGPGSPTRVPRSTTEFECFYRAEARDLVRFLVWLGAPLADAADVAQDTMIEAYRQWSTIRRPRAWIRTVASRTFLRRLAQVDQPVEDVDGRPLLSDSCDLITAWLQHQEILRLLALLPPRQRQVMAWIFDGYSPKRIAPELGITPDDVRSNLRLARRALAEHLRKEDPQ